MRHNVALSARIAIVVPGSPKPSAFSRTTKSPLPSASRPMAVCDAAETGANNNSAVMFDHLNAHPGYYRRSHRHLPVSRRLSRTMPPGYKRNSITPRLSLPLTRTS